MVYCNNTKDEIKNRISLALKDPILQQGFEIICKKLTELEKANEWHYVKNGDLPKKSISVLAYFEEEDVSLVECLYIPDEGFKHPIFSEWYEPTAWIEKEKILPGVFAGLA